ncbi:phosphatase PAP2 family protein [Micromonospora echinofusca]|uniref:Phosphatase PAP2 family protein n=1 Tax=Micromonospora echinofusca TaxID=47858 RepID=A0ABS3VVS1_MICEH|nr:phosphatase PAP2 family protein [Micromonospora echinofusca]MBO4208629.1 phosphatase PAP2 family protein [Micromonospora echinofusca]
MTTVKEMVRRPLGHFAERSLAGLAVILGAGVGFGILLVLVRTRWSPLYDVDHGVAAWLNDLVAPHGPLVTVLNAITDLGGRPVIIWLVTVAVVGLLIRRQARLAVYVIVTGAGALILDPALKTLVGRLRPEVDVPIGSYAGESFPSGHALGSMVAYGALLLVFLPAMAPRWRRPAIVLVATVVAAIGLTRIALGVHFVSDVLGAWLLGAAWLGVTAYAFRLWRRERGRTVPPLAEGLEPEAGHDIAPAPAEEQVLPHPRSAVAELVVGWVLVFGVLFGFGTYVSFHAEGTVFETLDTDVPQWFADRHTDALTDLSWWWSKFGDTHAILLVSMVFCPLVLAVWRRWRPVLFVALAMFGELSLFLASAAAVDRPRPAVENLDGPMPTSSFPSGHIAATICLYAAIAVLVFPRTDRWWRWVPVALAVIMPLGVAISRMYRGMHHPTDFMGAILLSALWISLLYWVLRPNADLRQGNQPVIESEDVHTLDDELVKAGRPD